MKKILISLIILLSIGLSAFAQEKTFRFEMGLNYPIGLKKNSSEENRIGAYINGIYNFSSSPLNMNLRLGLEGYTVSREGYYGTFKENSLSVVPAINYNILADNRTVNIFGGVGAGVSIDNLVAGVFNEGSRLHLVAVPQVGIRFIKHINLSAQYYITKKYCSRLMINLGYIF